MKGKIARTIAIIAAGSMLSVTGAGVASASPSDDVIGTGSSSASSVDIAGQLSELRVELADTMEKTNFTAMGSALDETKSLVTGIVSGQRSSISSETVTLAKQASVQTDEVKAALAKVKNRIGGLPDPLTLVSSLLSTLLDTLSSLVSSLLGGVPSVSDVGVPGAGGGGGGLPLPTP
ncbi:MAG: hypothetical protein GEV04_06390 [Actinophytocola sp.]|nr:hypothetical protein [Actinophytocola sp.]